MQPEPGRLPRPDLHQGDAEEGPPAAPGSDAGRACARARADVRVQTAAARPARGLVKVSAACYASPSASLPPDRVGVGSGKGSLMTWAWFLFLWECFLRGCVVVLERRCGELATPLTPKPRPSQKPKFSPHFEDQ